MGRTAAGRYLIIYFVYKATKEALTWNGGYSSLTSYSSPDDERVLEGEQGRARQVVQEWFANQ